MIIRTTLLTLLLLSSFQLSAQITIGVKAGGTIATVSETPTLADIRETGNISGLMGGFFLELGNEALAIRPEVLFQQRGYSYELESIDTAFLQRFNYLDIPITVRFRFGSSDVRVYVEGGASLGFVLRGIEEASIDGNTTETDIIFEEIFGADGRRERTYDLTGIVGAGIEFKIGPGMLMLGGRYNLDLNDFYEFEDDQEPSGWEAVKWRSFDVSIGYGFRLF